MNTPFKMYGKSPMMKALVGKQGNLPQDVQAKILASPATMKKSPTKQTGLSSAERTQNFRDAGNKTKTVSSKTNVGNKVVNAKTSTKAASFGSKTLKNFQNLVTSSSDKSTSLGPKNTVGGEIKRGAKEFTESAMGRIKNIKVPSGSSNIVKAAKVAGDFARVASKMSGAGIIAELGYRAYKSGQKNSDGKVNKNQKSNTMGFGKSSIFNKKSAPTKNYKKGYYGA